MFGAFRAAIQPVAIAKEDLDAKIWGLEPVGVYTDVMTREQLQEKLQADLLKEANWIVEIVAKPEINTEVYDTQIRTFMPEPNQRAVATTFQHPLLTYNLLKKK